MCLQEIHLLQSSEAVGSDELNAPENIAPEAIVSVSSVHPDYKSSAAVDGAVDGFPRNMNREWASKGEQDTATLRLTWSTPEKIDRIWLFDRPNTLDQVKSGMLVFSDGTTLTTGPLPDEARQGLEVSFEPRTVRWLVFVVTGVKKGTQNIGLSEIAVFRARGS
jgi:hypothetical protein